MLPGKPFFHPTSLKAIAAGLIIFAVSSCGVVPKGYPVKKPFVYEYKINLQGNFTNAQRSDLVSKLENQLDDSIHIRTIPQLYRQLLKKPPVYDAAFADRSVKGMKVLLNSLGYFNNTVTYFAKIDTVEEKQYRAFVTFDVMPGKPVTLDSITYNIKHAELQKLADSTMGQSLLKKGTPFAKLTIGNEFSRLIDLYRNNGYMRFTMDELRGLWDTLDVSLLNPSLDPFEQLELLQRMKERRENPKANIEIQLRPGYDPRKLIKYYNGQITVYPDYNLDTIGFKRNETIVNGVKVVYYAKIFKPKLLPENIYLLHGESYNQEKYFRTVNRFNSLSAWRLVNIEQQPRSGTDTVDFNIRLTPAKKYSYTANIEGSINQSIISGNLFGLALNLGLENRNFAKAADQTNTNARYGVEFGSSGGAKFIQTKQVSLSHNIYFPRPIPNFRKITSKFSDNFRSVFSFNAANTERRYLYNLTTLNASWGYDFQWKKKLFSIRLPNIEYSFLNERDSLKTLISNNPLLKNVFTDGLISSMIASFTMSGGRNKNLNILRANVEGSGFLSSLIRSNFLDTHLYRFLKTDVELARKIQYRKSSIALHFFAGVGYEFASTKNPSKRNNLPFFKEYFAGGPNSMRAWPLRRLGPGSTIKEFTGSLGTPERYGDVQLETNFEYRFPVANIAGEKIYGALFTDIGNVWYLKKAAGAPEEVFSFSRLPKDIAIGVGGGLRVDFSFFVVRLDYAYKAKDPSPDPANAASQNKWFYNWKPLNGQLQLGIGYPFIF
ncbi:MAG TPA: BamA/TamA family outer membrane protein [Chitinophagaceae bacterium]|nr:BamA/TamA family outer membrane protein [Chitinophagaceae bacterium]